MRSVIVRPGAAEDMDRCVAIVRALPEYFTEEVPDQIRSVWGGARTWVADEDGVIGFALVEDRSAKAAEIAWAAVDPPRRSGGVGTRLVEAVVAALGAEGIELVEVKTLDASAGYEPYESTIAFWERRGFIQIDTIDPYPGWQPGNPCAIYVRALRATPEPAS